MLELVVGDADLLGHITAQVGVHSVAGADEVFEHRSPARGRKIERERSFVAIEALEEQRVLALVVRRDVAADVAAHTGVLDLDDIRAEVGQMQAAERAGTVLLEGDDADVFQWPHASESFACSSMSAGSSSGPFCASGK